MSMTPSTAAMARCSWSLDERLRIVAEWRQSGLSQSRFSETSSIHQTTLSRWVREARNAGAEKSHQVAPTKNAIVPVRVISPRPVAATMTFEIRLPGGIEVSVPPRFERVALENLLLALRTKCSR